MTSMAPTPRGHMKSAPTTIKVSTETRDRVKAHAARSERTIEQYINMLIDLADREQRWDALRAARANMTPSDWVSYNNEVSAWDRADLDRLPDEQW